MQVALITGGSKGLGLAFADSLVRDGWTVVIDGRDAVALAEAEAHLRACAADGPGRVVAIAGDVADAAHRAALVHELTALGRLDVLVNNASTLGPSPQPSMAEYPLNDFRRVLEVNVVAPLSLLQATLPMLRTANGIVIDVTSDAGVEGYSGWGGYGSSKAALEQLSNVLAAEEPDVHVYWFDPGDMRTEMHQAAFPGEDITDRPLPSTVVPALRRLIAESPPSGRFRAAELLEPPT